MAALAGGEVVGEAMPEGGVRVELGLQVLQVEREVQDRGVSGSGRGGRVHPGERRAPDHAETGQPRVAQEATPVVGVLGAALDEVFDHVLSEHASSTGR